MKQSLSHFSALALLLLFAGVSVLVFFTAACRSPRLERPAPAVQSLK
jgi:hypothetical protein